MQPISRRPSPTSPARPERPTQSPPSKVQRPARRTPNRVGAEPEPIGKHNTSLLVVLFVGMAALRQFSPLLTAVAEAAFFGAGLLLPIVSLIRIRTSGGGYRGQSRALIQLGIVASLLIIAIPNYERARARQLETSSGTAR